MELIVISVPVRQSGSLKYCPISNSYSKVGAYASLSYCQCKRQTLQKANSEQQSQMNILTCLLYIDLKGAYWNNLHKQHLQWSNGNEKEHFSSTFCLVNSASQSNYSVWMKNRLWPPSWAQDPNCFKAMAGLACWIEQSLSPLTVFDGGEYFAEQKKESGLSYTLLQWRGPFCQRDCSMAFSPTFQKQDAYWVLKDLVSVPVWILQRQLSNVILSGTI